MTFDAYFHIYTSNILWIVHPQQILHLYRIKNDTNEYTIFLQVTPSRHLATVLMLEFGNPNPQFSLLYSSLASLGGVRREPITRWTYWRTWPNWILILTHYITSVGHYRWVFLKEIVFLMSAYAVVLIFNVFFIYYVLIYLNKQHSDATL